MHLEELQMENEYQLRLKDMNYNEKMKEISDKFSQQIESLKNTQQVRQAACCTAGFKTELGQCECSV